MEIEITKELNLTQSQLSILDMHSFLNIMNILIGELQLFELELEFENNLELKKSIEMSYEIKDSLSEKSFSLISMEKFNEYKAFILNSLESINISPFKETNDIDPNFENIKFIFKVLEIRLIELRTRLDDPDKWDNFELEDIKSALTTFFYAVEKNSNGRYRIISNIAKKEEKDYLLDIKIESHNNKSIYMPLVFRDVIRDISANARKYTPIGGEITIGLWADEKKLTLVVDDTGKGIPENEIESVVDFGKRANNIMDQVTRGGGFGLTKAYYVTKKYKGRMWIKSEVNKGTRIKIEIPYLN
ncbi:MAG: ATP-binding protein [Cyanobacteriota bacterium]